MRAIYEVTFRRSLWTYIRTLIFSTCLLAACGKAEQPNTIPQALPMLGAASQTLSPAILPDSANLNSGSLDSEKQTTSSAPLSTEDVVVENTSENATAKPPLSQISNEAPYILNTSYGCDPIVESVAFSVGQTDTFTLSVDDEFPLSMQYHADSSSPEIVTVTVDKNGLFTVTAYVAGESALWLSVSDHEGLLDELELRVVVN